MSDRQQLGKILLEAQMVRREDIEKALEEQKRTGIRLGEALVKLGLVKGEDIHWGLSHQLEVPFIRLRPDAVDAEAVALVPEAVARKLRVVPFFVADDELTVVMDDPTRAKVVAELQAVTGCKINPAIGIPEEIQETLDTVYAAHGTPDLEPTPYAGSLLPDDALSASVADASGETLLWSLLRASGEKRATAVHFEPWNGGARVRLRVDGHLQDAGELSAGWARTVVQRVRETLESPGEQGPHLEGFIRSPENGTHGLYYVTIVASRRGPSVTFIDISAPEFGASLSELAVPTEDRDELIELLRARSGVVLVAGTNRAQKLRFFDLLLREKKAAERKTFTLGRMPWFSEDRYIQVRVRTEEAGEALDALRVIAEQEPDIVAVEDAWNERVVALIFQSVQRPVLCMAGLHLRTALAALEYTLDAVPNRTLVAEGLRGVVAVAAFRRLCPECRKPDERTAEAARKLGLSHAEIKAGALRRAEGCAVCGGGFSGLVPVVEVLRVDRETAEYLKIEESGPKIRDHLLAKGYRAIDVKVRNLILAGEIEFDEYPYAEGG